MKTGNTSWVLVVTLLYASLVVAHPTDSHANVENECASPYQPIGPTGYCLLIDNRLEGTWDQMREFCHQVKGDLAFIHDANLLYDIIIYLEENYLNDTSFWIGSEDLLDEGSWVWSWNNDDVRMNTPLWGSTRNSQEPRGGTSQNCGFLDMEKYYFMNDGDCKDVHAVICDPLTNKGTNLGKTSQKDDIKSGPSAGCPVPFEVIGDSCLMIDGIKTNTWEDGKQLCEGLGGNLAKIDDANILSELYDRFHNKSMSLDMWLGGTDADHEGNWLWMDKSPVKIGTPFWGINYYGKQEPDGGTAQNCLVLSHANFYFFNDLKCSETGGVICQYDM